MKIIAIGGEPGSGKTTLMKKIIEYLAPEPRYNEFKLVPYLNKNNVYILGKYEDNEIYSGTDRMSMAVQPAAIEFLKTLPKNSIVLYEGDRLFTASFLEHCLDNYELDIIYLSTDSGVRKNRYKERGSEQNEIWLQGRETKISNILSNMVLMFSVFKYPNNNLEDQRYIVDNILNRIMET